MASNTSAIIDLTDYKDRMGARVAPGRYRVVVEDTEMDQSKAGNQMFNIWFRILDEGDFKDMTISDRLTNTPKALFRIVGFMQAIGLPTPRKRLQVDIAKWVGRVLEIDVEDGEPYNGRIRSEVRGYIKATGSNAQSAASETDLEDLVEEPAAAEAAPAPEAIDLDEIEL